MLEAAEGAAARGECGILAAARTQIGVRFQHQGRLAGEAIDCIGLVVLSFRAASIYLADRTDYSEQPSEGALRTELQSQFRMLGESEAWEDGDLASFVRRPGKDVSMSECHVAILSASRMMIHTSFELGRVVEHAAAGRYLPHIGARWRYMADG